MLGADDVNCQDRVGELRCRVKTRPLALHCLPLACSDVWEFAGSEVNCDHLEQPPESQESPKPYTPARIQPDYAEPGISAALTGFNKSYWRSAIWVLTSPFQK